MGTTTFHKILLFVLLFSLLIGCNRGGDDDAPFIPNNSNNVSTLAELHSIFLANYLYPEDLPVSLEGFTSPDDYVDFVNNKRAENDRFSSYLDPEAFTEFNSTIFEGRAFIGIQFDPHEGIISSANPLTIQSPTPFSRAFYDGIQAGDILLEVDGISTAGMTFDQVREFLPTMENEPVNFKIERSLTEITINTSAENSVELIVEPTQGIGYISLRTFSAGALGIVRSDFLALQAQGVTKLIVDVRGNTGGSIIGVRDLLNFFISTNGLLLYSFQDRNGVLESQATGPFTDRENTFDETNMVVLADSDSLSASELLVNGLKVYQEATFIGTQTGGKGVAQGVFNLTDGSGAVVVSRFILGPDNDNYHLIGITPDFASITTTTPSLGNDSQLEDAVTFLTD